MCGIAGTILADGSTADPQLIRRMTGIITRRGPDAEGFFTAGEAALGYRRLSIIDLATSDQPMTNEDGSLLTGTTSILFSRHRAAVFRIQPTAFGGYRIFKSGETHT